MARACLEDDGQALRSNAGIDDKIIKRVRETNETLGNFTGKFEREFFDDLTTLNFLVPHETPRATEHIAEIVVLIEQLIGHGLAYKAPDGSVYFSIEKYRVAGKRYGQLVKLNFEEMRAGERVRYERLRYAGNPFEQEVPAGQQQTQVRRMRAFVGLECGDQHRATLVRIDAAAVEQVRRVFERRFRAFGGDGHRHAELQGGAVRH